MWQKNQNFFTEGSYCYCLQNFLRNSESNPRLLLKALHSGQKKNAHYILICNARFILYFFAHCALLEHLHGKPQVLKAFDRLI